MLIEFSTVTREFVTFINVLEPESSFMVAMEASEDNNSNLATLPAITPSETPYLESGNEDDHIIQQVLITLKYKDDACRLFTTNKYIWPDIA